MDARELGTTEAELMHFCSGQFVVAVIGKGTDFVLFRIDGGRVFAPESPAAKDAAAKGYAFCGVIAVVDGEPDAKCALRLDATITVLSAALAIAREIANLTKQEPEGDAVAWLQSLFELPDLR